MRILLFGRLRDLAGASEIAVSERMATLSDLRRFLAREHPELALAVAESCVRVAIDRRIVALEADLGDAREVAFMPPMSGG